MSSRQEISQETNLLPYSKAIQIGTKICQANTKPWNKQSRISELNLKKLREEIIGAYISWEEKIVLEQMGWICLHWLPEVHTLALQANQFQKAR